MLFIPTIIPYLFVFIKIIYIFFFYEKTNYNLFKGSIFDNWDISESNHSEFPSMGNYPVVTPTKKLYYKLKA